MTALVSLRPVGGTRRCASNALCVLLFLTLIIVGSTGCRRRLVEPADGGAPDSQAEENGATEPPTDSVAPPPCLQAPGSFAEISARLRPNVVTIFGRAERTSTSGPLSALPLMMPGATPAPAVSEGDSEPEPALGSGFLVGMNELVITSGRVVEGAAALSVVMHNGQRIPATLRGTDPELDIALLILEEPPAEAHTISDTARLRPGDWVAVLADPFGAGATVTAGVLRFDISSGETTGSPQLLRSFLGVDATIDSANWGGPVVDTSGRLVGLAVAAPRAGSQIGLVVPASRLRRTVSQLAEHGHPARTWIGLWVRPLDEERARELRVDPPRGLLVTRIAPGGPAQEAGIEPDDVIVELAGQVVTTPGDLGALASSTSAGATQGEALGLPLVVIRDGRPRNLRLRPAPMPQ